MTNPSRFFKPVVGPNEERRATLSTRMSGAEAEFQEALVTMSSEELSGIDIDEFREFVMGSETDLPVRHEFKEGLRRELWWMMVSRLVRRARSPSS